MNQHTAEPWSIYKGENSAHCGIDGSELNGKAVVSYQIEREADARRIVACVNACNGIETEILEATIGLNEQHDELIQQRDKLLNALKQANLFLSIDGNLLATTNSLVALSIIRRAISKHGKMK